MQPLKWHGGKSYLAKKIIELMPPHTRYCEPFFGGGAVLFQKPCEGVSEFVNDLNSRLMYFWRVLRSEELFQQFYRAMQAIPLSEEEFTSAKMDVALDGRCDIVRDAIAFFIRYRQSRQGLGKDFCTPTSRTRRGMNENVSAWLTAVDGLPEAHARLRRVEIHNRDACEFIAKLDSPDTLFYCDPPYLHETRAKGAIDAYECEMTEDEHRRLLLTLARCEGRFILSGYPSALYDRWEQSMGFRHVDFEIDNKSSGAKVKEKKIERVWMNF